MRIAVALYCGAAALVLVDDMIASDLAVAKKKGGEVHRLHTLHGRVFLLLLISSLLALNIFSTQRQYNTTARTTVENASHCWSLSRCNFGFGACSLGFVGDMFANGVRAGK